MLKPCPDKPLTAHALTAMQHDLAQVAQRADLIPAGFARRIERLVQVARYYRKDQLARRAWKVLVGGRRLPWVGVRLRTGQVRFAEAERDALARIARLRSVRMADNSKAFREELERGVVTLLGERRVLGEPLDWSAEIMPRPGRLWRFHLHYQEYLLDLAAGSGWQCDTTWATIWKIVEDWIEDNPLYKAKRDSDAWHPYCVSRRLAVWLQLAAVELPAGQRGERVLASCAEQAEFLSRHLETDLGGNHLLENVYALVLASAALRLESKGHGRPPSAVWLGKAEKVLRRELPRQILAHGEHFERSPMYHCHVLGNLLQMAIVCKDLAPELAAHCKDTAVQMWRFLAMLLHPDGEIPLFGDSVIGESYSVAELRRLLELAGIDEEHGSPRPPAADAPYWVWRYGGDCLIFDAGKMAEDSLPAHGHCDLLGFEASVDGKRWFVDSGAYRYDDAAMRRYCRSSVAHNVVTVDDVDQCDVWSSFRMGYRGWPTSFSTGSQGPFEWVSAAHNAYRRLGVSAAERVLIASRCGIWGCFDHVRSKDSKGVTGRLHLAPGVCVEQLNERRFMLELGKSRRMLTFVGVAGVGLAAAWHCARFGEREPTRVFEYTAGEHPCAVLGWLLTSPEADITTTIVEQGTETRVRVQLGRERTARGPFAAGTSQKEPVTDVSEKFEWRFGRVEGGVKGAVLVTCCAGVVGAEVARQLLHQWYVRFALCAKLRSSKNGRMAES